MDAVREDLGKTFYPSWIQKAPSNFGAPGQGKLRASQWRSVCMISLVITLVRLWGTPGAPKATTRNQKLLENFLCLVIAVDLATRRHMSSFRAQQYDFFIYKYLAGLREIFQHVLVPNHHLSMHLSECLAAFGPVQGWWAFPFERYNGLVSRQRTNAKSREPPFPPLYARSLILFQLKCR